MAERQPIRRTRAKTTYASNEAKSDAPKGQKAETDEEEDSAKSSDNDANPKILTQRNSGSSEDGGLADADPHACDPSRDVEKQVELPADDEKIKDLTEDAH